ncbi:MAG: Ig-like domain-containing protein, partial [Phycisphaerales bacterium]|nr:Ig-like domain-containing protein [Phycisphaerales bacterium]
MAIGTDETIYFGVNLEDVSGRLYATNAITGFFRKWDFPHPVRVAPVVRSDGSVLVASGHILSALSTNGAVEWTFNTGNPDDQPGTPLTGGPILDQLGNIYFVDLAGVFYALAPDGKERWPSRRLGYRADASPAIGENDILYALAVDEGPAGPALHVYALDLKREGALVWTAPVLLPPQDIYSSPVIGARGGIYFGGIGRFYAVIDEGASGRLAWSYDVEEHVFSAPLLTTDGVLYFGSGAAGIAGRFYALQASEPPANSFWPMFRRDPRRSGNVVGGNEPPKVTLTKPAAGARFPAPASVSLEATASDPDGSVKQVEFFVDAISAGVDSTAPFAATSRLLDAGTYVLTARASDDRG